MNECRHRWNRYWTFGSLAVIFASAAAAMAMGRFTISPRELAAVLVPCLLYTSVLYVVDALMDIPDPYPIPLL